MSLDVYEQMFAVKVWPCLEMCCTLSSLESSLRISYPRSGTAPLIDQQGQPNADLSIGIQGRPLPSLGWPCRHELMVNDFVMILGSKYVFTHSK